MWGLRLAIIAALLGGWYRLTDGNRYWSGILSTPRKVWDVLFSWFDGTEFIRTHLQATLTEAALGYLLGLGVSIVLVAIVVPFKLADRFLSPFIAAVNALPKLAMAPLFIVWFGLTTRSKVYFIAFAIFFILFIGIYTGMKTIDSLYVDNLRSLGASRRHVLVHVYVPSILSWVLTSLRISASWALLGAVISEYIGAVKGVGQVIFRGSIEFRPDDVVAGILVVAFIAVLFDRLLLRVERHFSSWKLA